MIRVSEIKPDKCNKTTDGWIVDNLMSVCMCISSPAPVYTRVSEIKPDKCNKTTDGWIVDNLMSICMCISSPAPVYKSE